ITQPGAATRRRVSRPSLPTQRAPTTQPPVLTRSLPTPSATPILQRGAAHLKATLAVPQIPRLVLVRCKVMQPAVSIPRTVFRHSLAIPPAQPIRRPVLKRSVPTRPEEIIPRLVLLRCQVTQTAMVIRLTALKRFSAIPPVL